VFGVVNIVTRQGRWLDGGTAEITAGSWGAGRLATTYGSRSSSGVEVLVGGSTYRRSGPDLYFPEFDDPASNDGLAVGLDDDRYTRGFAKIGYEGLTFDTAFYSRTKSIPTASYGTEFGADSWTLDAVGYARLASERTFDDLSRLRTEASYNRYVYEGQYTYEDGLSTDGVDAHWIRASSQYDRRLGGRNRLLVGGELLHNMKAQQWADWDGERYLDSDEGGTPWGVFAQNELRLGPNVSFTFGLRHDHYQTFGGTTNPRLALVWTPGTHSAVKLLYGTAFRAPNAYELYYDDAGFSTKVPDRLDPERVRSFEAVVEHQFRPGLRANISVFRMDLEDLVGQVLDPADGLYVFRNVAEARTAGVEIGADYRSASGISAAGGYTLQSARDSITGFARYNAPRHLAKARVSVPVVGDRARASVVAHYVSSQTNVWDEDVPPYTVADLAVTTWLRSNRLALDVKAVNLFDAKYGTPPSVDIDLTTVPQDRRSFRIGLRVLY
jgi:iron complex outermembrane receptor protein